MEGSIPQRGVVSVTLYLVAINEELGNGIDELLFADHLIIYITFSPSKIVSMTFRKRNEEPIEIIMRSEIRPSKESTQILGMTLNSILNWKEYINKLRAKAKIEFNTIKVVSGEK